MPAIPLILVFFGYIARITRTGMIDALHADYTRTAILKGLPRRTVVMRHVLRNALLPTVTVATTQLGYLIGGLVVVETIFHIPGAGGFFVNSILNRDGFLLGGVVIVYCLLLMIFNLLVDLSYRFLDRRIQG